MPSIKASEFKANYTRFKSYTSQNELIVSWGLLIILSLIWGSSFILIKKGLVVLSAGEVGALRIVSASLFLLPLAIKKLRTVSKRHLGLLLASGLMGSFFPAFLFAKAQTQLTSSMTGILNALTPLFVLVVGGFMFKQKITANQIFGLIVGFIGTGLLIFAKSGGGFGEINFYAFFVVLATFLYGNNLNLIKFYIPDLKPVVISSVSMMLIGPFAAGYLFFGTDFITNISNKEGAFYAVSAIVLLGVMGTALALILFNKLVQMTSPVFTSSVTYFIPIVAVLWGLLDGEQFFIGHFIGMAAIILGVFLANKKKKGS
jgi:drug/metabolite transporter (DMT)-like permease